MAANALVRALTTLECAAVEPGVGPVLFVDLDPSLLRAFAATFSAMVGALEPELGKPEVHVLGPWDDGEALWSRLQCLDDRIVAVPGPLAEEPGRPAPVVAIPRLGSAGLAVVQALLTQVGAEAFRSGVSRPPRARWLAAVDSRDLATMSAHLADRFAARIDGLPLNAALLRIPMSASADPNTAIRGRISTATATAEQLIEQALADRPPLKPAAQRAKWTPEAGRAVLRALRPEAGRRRDLALAHAARALAIRLGAATVSPRQVIAAARLLGLDSSGQELAEQFDSIRRISTSDSAVSSESDTAPTAWDHTVAEADDRLTGRPTRGESVGAPGMPVDLDALPFSTPPAPRGADSLFPEQGPGALPVLGSLREARRRRAHGVLPRGPVVGDKLLDSPAGLHDLALCATLVRASMLRAAWLRNAEDDAGNDTGDGTADPIGWNTSSDLGIRPIRPTELRQHRRSSRTSACLILVLDHSCFAGWAWPVALMPHLRWAYQASASVTLIECGHRDTPNEFAAHRTRARSLADPPVVRALSGLAPGRATPLAHALDLAAVELRRSARAGGDTEIRVVVATDGRGNIPLSASSRGRAPSAPVHREGIEDGLRAAEAIRGLTRSPNRCHLVGPEADHHPELLFELARRLGAELRRFRVEDRVGDRATVPGTLTADRTTIEAG